MNKPPIYYQKMQQACDYIYRHLDQPLTVEQVSSAVHSSKYHFHRQFSSCYGISVYQFILHLRLKRAAYQLTFNLELKLIDIALAAGYENQESFTRAFKKILGLTPSQFRKKPQWQLLDDLYPMKKMLVEQTFEVEMVNFQGEAIAVMEYQGSPKKIHNAGSQFVSWRRQSTISPIASMNTYGLIYHDPVTTPEHEYRYDFCAAINQPLSDSGLNNEFSIVEKYIPAGPCAKIRHKGPWELLAPAIYYLYGPWLEQSGASLREFPLYFHYLNLFPMVEEYQLVTDIYLPIEPVKINGHAT